PFLPPTSPPPLSTLFPYTTLFRSVLSEPPGADGGTQRGGLADEKEVRREQRRDGQLAERASEVMHRRSERRQEEMAGLVEGQVEDRKSTRLNSSHVSISYAVFCLK